MQPKICIIAYEAPLSLAALRVVGMLCAFSPGEWPEGDPDRYISLGPFLDGAESCCGGGGGWFDFCSSLLVASG
jgi:hypothetical protein